MLSYSFAMCVDGGNSYITHYTCCGLCVVLVWAIEKLQYKSVKTIPVSCVCYIKPQGTTTEENIHSRNPVAAVRPCLVNKAKSLRNDITQKAVLFSICRNRCERGRQHRPCLLLPSLVIVGAEFTHHFELPASLEPTMTCLPNLLLGTVIHCTATRV